MNGGPITRRELRDLYDTKQALADEAEDRFMKGEKSRDFDEELAYQTALHKYAVAATAYHRAMDTFIREQAEAA